jgi:hypothetical protein
MLCYATTTDVLDYITGRINGQFSPNDPIVYRRKIRKENNNNNNVFFGSNSKKVKDKVIADSINNNRS